MTDGGEWARLSNESKRLKASEIHKLLIKDHILYRTEALNSHLFLELSMNKLGLLSYNEERSHGSFDKDPFNELKNN